VVQINPDIPILAPNDEIPIQVAITPPTGFAGKLNFNVNAFHDNILAGGVTLTVEAGV
jgi:hypothetical protein